MRKYELMVLFTKSVDPTDDKARDVLLAKLLGQVYKKITNTTTLGKKQLAYMIKKETETVYVVVQIEADTIDASAIDKQSKLMPEVLRYLLITLDK